MSPQAQLAAAVQSKNQAENALLSIPGVNAVDVGYKYVNGRRTDQVAVRIHVSQKRGDVPENEKIPETIDGLPTDVIEEVYEPHQFTMPVEEISIQSDTGRYRPVKGGISIGPDRSVGGLVYAGTLGCIVSDNATGKKMMLSNFHVMCIDNTWHVGDKMNQPSLIDTGTHADTVGTLARAVLSAHVDGAVANINAGISNICQIADIGNVNGTTTAVLGMPVRKKGRTTLLTYGFVDGLSATVNINYGGAIGTRTFTNQITIRPDTARNPQFSDHGDSGSAIVDNSINVVGLLFAGSPSRTIANPIAFVEQELNVKVCKYMPKPIKEFVKDKPEKLEHKEIKEIKLEKVEKHELKEKELKEVIADNKHIKDIADVPKPIGENPGNPGFPGNPGNPGPIGQQDLEARIQQLEQTIGELSTFIQSGLRPDLSQGALNNE